MSLRLRPRSSLGSFAFAARHGDKSSSGAATQVRRLIAEALGRDGWSDDTLRCVRAFLHLGRAPRGAAAAMIELRRPLAGDALRHRLLNALAVPDWEAATVAEIGALLLEAAPDNGAPEIVALSARLGDLRS